MYEKIIKSILPVIMLFTILIPYKQVEATNEELSVNAKSAILVEASTGTILFGENIDESLPIASMAKVMTEYLVLEAIDKKKITWDQTYTPSEYVYNISQNRNLSNVPLRKDGSYNVKELFEAMSIYSANGAAIALAEIVAGSEANFVTIMNEKVEELGLKNSEFVNSTGLENKDLQGMHPEGTSVGAENRMSARDMAILSQKLLKNYPEVLDTSSISKKVFREGTDDSINMDNWNWMLDDLIFEYEGVDGLKTGSTDSAGSCFTATAVRDGMRVISVVMDATNSEGSLYTPRFDETQRLLDFAFNNFSIKEVFPKNYEVKNQSILPVVKGKEEKISTYSKDSLTLVVRNGEENSYTAKVTVDKSKLAENNKLTAPIKKNEKVGTMTVEYTGKGHKLSFLEENKGVQTDIIAKSTVEKANWFILSMRGIGNFFGNQWSNLSDYIKDFL